MNILFFLKPKSDIVYIYDYFTIRQALEKMKHHGFSAIPVIERNGKYAGTLSEGNLLWAILEHDAFDKHIREKYSVRDILKGRQNTPVNVNASIEDLFLMARSQNFIPVTDDRGLFIGIVTRSDILLYYHQKKNQKK